MSYSSPAALRDAGAERVPPQNLDAEMSVLGAMLLEESAISETVELLDSDSFYKGAHQKIFAAIL